MSIDFNSSYTMTINGQAVVGESALEVVNPATAVAFARAPDATQVQLDQAVAAARAAFRSWADRTHAERQAVLQAIAERIDENVENFARLLTREQGKPIDQARKEILVSVLWLRETAKMSLPSKIVEDTPERRIEVRRVPLGVVGAIVPWNFPFSLAVWKIAPALLTGNTLVLKPSPFTPLVTLKLGELLRDVVPPGVLNVVSGGDALGPWMSSHTGIDKIAFTGSTATGKRIMETASRDLKRLTLELGGNDVAIVMPDVNIEKIVPILFLNAFRNSAQICTVTKRMYIHADIYEKLSKALVTYAKAIKLGDGADETTQMGPIQNRPQFERLQKMLKEAREQNLKFLMVGDVPEGKGFFFPITLVDNPPDTARVVTEEAFGPILPLMKFKDIDEVIERANNNPYGLGGTVWSADLGQAKRIAERLQTGTVWINQPIAPSPKAPFAGRKQSGLGIENGAEGLLEYTATQTIMLNTAQP